MVAGQDELEDSDLNTWLDALRTGGYGNALALLSLTSAEEVMSAAEARLPKGQAKVRCADCADNMFVSNSRTWARY